MDDMQKTVVLDTTHLTLKYISAVIQHCYQFPYQEVFFINGTFKVWAVWILWMSWSIESDCVSPAGKVPFTDAASDCGCLQIYSLSDYCHTSDDIC